MVNKDTDDWTKEEKENVQRNLKVKTIITTVFGLHEFLCIFHGETAREMQDTLQITHEGTSEVKRVRMDTLIHEYKLFRMKLKENIYDMQKQFIHIVNQKRTRRKVFQNGDFVVKFIRCLNRSWQLKIIAIFESKNLSSIFSFFQ